MKLYLIPDDQPDADNKVCPTMKKRSKSGKVKAKPKSQKDKEIISGLAAVIKAKFKCST